MIYGPSTASERALDRMGMAWLGALITTALLVAWVLGGCAARVKNVTNLPPGVTEKQVQDWDAAVGDLHKVALTVAKLHAGVDAVHASGLLSDEYYVEVLRVIGNFDVMELNAAEYLRATPQRFGEPQKRFVAAQINAILGELRKVNTEYLAGIKNPNSQAEINRLIGDVSAVLGLVLSLTQ